MQDLTEAYFAIYEEEEKLPPLFPGAPRRSEEFPLSKEKQELARKIGTSAKTKAADIAGASQTKSPSKPPTTKPEQTPTLRRSRGTTNRSGDTWKASTTEQFDFYDLVLDYLLDEGYADTEENAISMMSAMSEDWINTIVERFSMANDASKPQSPKPTKLPRSREANIGRHDDWKDKPSTEWGDRPPAAKKLASRLRAVVGTQQRQDKETGVR